MSTKKRECRKTSHIWIFVFLDYDISNSQEVLYNLSKYITDWNYGDENYS